MGSRSVAGRGMDGKLTVEDRQLLEAAREAATKAYAPYSCFPVGAALLGADGSVFTGCNVENVSYGLTLCAERVALGKAVAAGVRRFKALAVWAPVAVWPCGACRQCLAEFAPELRILRGGEDGSRETTTLLEIFPAPFHISGTFHLSGNAG